MRVEVARGFGDTRDELSLLRNAIYLKGQDV